MRADGRATTEYREVAVTSGIFAHTCGSARAVVGGGLGAGTEVLAGVSAEICEAAAKSDEGFVEVSVECSPLMYAGDDRAQQAKVAELTRKLQRLVDDSMVGDVSALCVVKGAFVWKLHVDLLVLSDEGGVLDASSFAAYIALATARLPRTKEAVMDGGELDFDLDVDAATLPLATAKRLPVVVTVTKTRDGDLIVDADELETAAAQSALVVALNGGEEVCAVDQVAGTLTVAEVEAALDVAEVAARALFTGFEAHVRPPKESRVEDALEPRDEALKATAATTKKQKRSNGTPNEK